MNEGAWRKTMRRMSAAALAATLAGCGASAERSGALALAECRLPRLATAAQCGTVEVPEDRSRPDGRKIGLFVAVLRANTLSPKPDPLLILAGGPGQAATSIAPFAARLAEVRRTRDIVLVDQRGTGRSAPLDCAALKPDEVGDEIDVDPLPKARECLAELTSRGVDPAQYTTQAWIADLEAVRQALGVATWNLWGGSYGTRVAQEYVRRHPERVRTATLDGVAPPSLKVTLDVWRTRERALEDLLAACGASTACSRSRPKLGDALDRIRQALDPDGREIALPHPRTGEADRVRLTYDGVLAALQPLTYSPEFAAVLPEVLGRAADGDFGPLVAAAQFAIGDLSQQMNVALHYSVTCAEDVPRVTEDERRQLASLRAAPLARAALSVCEVWPRGAAPADAFTPLTSDLPVLMFSGGLDPVTPPAYAELVGKTLSNHQHVVANAYGHIVSLHACGPRLIASFVDRAGFDRLPPGCLEHFARAPRPLLWPDRLAPAP